MSLVSAEPVREHLLKLRAAGGTYHSIGQAADTGAMTVHRIANPDRPKVQAEVARRLLAVTEADIRRTHPAPGGTMWRLRALIAMGHTCSRMAAATGIPAGTLRRIVRGEALTVSPELRRAVIALFDAWWDKTPPQRTRQETVAVGNALKRAALNGWPCPAGLDEDELDCPGYHPQSGWRHARGTGVADDHPLRRKEGRVMKIRLPGRRRAADAGRAQDATSTPEPVAVTWARAQLREQIQRVGAALDPAAQPAERQRRETEHSPLADREAEP